MFPGSDSREACQICEFCVIIVAQRHTNCYKDSLSILGMGRPSYVCTVCSEHFTRKSSAKRHNHNIHNGVAEIVRLIDYLAGRSSGQYMPDNPFWYKPNNPYFNFGSATIADNVGDAFQPRYIPQQKPLGISQYSTSSQILRPTNREDQQRHGTGLSQHTVVKIEELKRLVYKYPQYQNNDPDGIIKWAVLCSINGDNRFLNEKLEQLRSIDKKTFSFSLP